MSCPIMSCNDLSASIVTSVTGVTCVGSISSIRRALAMSSLRIMTLATGFATSLILVGLKGNKPVAVYSTPMSLLTNASLSGLYR
jgi:hypothetical protein